MKNLVSCILPVIFIMTLPERWSLPIAGSPLQYSPDKAYHYTYTTQVTFNEPSVDTATSKASRDVGLKLSCSVQLQPVWYTSNNMLVKLQVSKPQLHGVVRHGVHRDLRSFSKFPLFFHWEGSRVGQVYIATGDPTWAQNLKMGIASLLQVQRESGARVEVDVSGECDVEYKVHANHVSKLKSNCKNLEFAGQFNNVNPLLSLTQQASRETSYELGEDIITSIRSTETHDARVNMQQNLAAALQSQQELKLEKTTSGGRVVHASTLNTAIQQISKQEKLELNAGLLGTSLDNRQCTDNCIPASDTIDKYRDDLANGAAASVESAQAFLRLTNVFRSAKKNDLVEMLKNQTNYEIVPVLIDAMVAAQTSPAQDALMEILDFREENDITLPERYLLAAAFSTHPSYKLLHDLLGVLKQGVPDVRLRESVAEALGAVVYTYSRKEGQEEDKIVGEIEAVFLEQLRACEDDACKTMLLRALSNAGLPNTVPTLLEFAENSKQAVISEAAVKAFRRIDLKHITKSAHDVMRRIYHQTKRGYDSAVRSQALRHLLLWSGKGSAHAQKQTGTGTAKDTGTPESGGLNLEEVTSLLKTVVGDPDAGELQTYVLARLWTESESDKRLRETLETALKDPAFRNWNIMAPGGKALAFKENMADTGGVTATYDMYVENSKAHIMKRSGMDVDVTSEQQTLPLYSFGLFAAGLEGLLGEEVEEGQEDVEPTAGLALNLIDVALRPVTFFVGQGGLMSAVWSAPSDLVSAFQANLLLQDHAQRIHLQNGLVVELNVQGVVSMDLSGLVSISLWHKNCKSLIKNSGALLVEGSMGIQTAVFQSGIQFSSEAASLIDFKTDVDFSEKLKMCLQMSRPGLQYKHTVKKHEKAQGFPKSYTAQIRRKQNIPEVSYPLPKPNNNQCRALLATET